MSTLFGISLLLQLALAHAANIIFVMTDDQDLQLDSMVAMPYIKADLIEQGTTMENAFASTPICC